MFKPLLRVIPTLSGNVKLACNLLDYEKYVDQAGNDVYETNVRYAKLYPISANLWNKKIDAGLLGSSWEYDVKKFYETYSDIFYKDCFEYDKYEMLKLDKHNIMNVRNKDFEFGVKRISYSKNGNQFACFAPIYIDNVNDIPGYFMLDIKLDNGAYKITKRIKINIGNPESYNNKYNYLSNYLNKYVSKIDDNVIFCLPKSKQAAYWGIDVVHGGFSKCVDNAISIIYTNQNTIQNFDALICNGFKRNSLIMKQIIPLAFYFNVNDILDDREKYRYANSQVQFSGNYYTNDDVKVDFYDFDFDYDELKSDVLQMDDDYGVMSWNKGFVDNIMDIDFPSLNECRYIKYQFANKLTPMFCRWKMKYSDDENPYIMNMSWAFSNNQNSNYKYGLFPVNYYQIEGLANYIYIDNEYQYNMLLPLSNNKILYYDVYDESIAKDYKSIMNNYCLNWFEVINDYDDSIYNNDSLWKTLNDDCVYYNGILYDISNIYNSVSNPQKIDKFGVFVLPETNILTWPDITNLKFASNVLFRQISSNVTNPNAIVNDSLLYSHFVEQSKSNYLYLEESWSDSKRYQDELAFNEIFTYSYNTGYFVDINEIGLDYYELNKYYDASKISYIIEDVYENKVKKDIENGSSVAYLCAAYTDALINPSSYIISSYLQIPVYKAVMLTYSDSDTGAIDDYNSYYAYIDYIEKAFPTIDDDKNRYAYSEAAKITYSHPFDNAYILNMPNFSNYLKENLYVHSFDEQRIKFNSTYATINWPPGSPNKYSYLVSGNTEYINNLYGNTFYVKHDFFKYSYVSDMHGSIDASKLRSYLDVRSAQDFALYGQSYWSYSDISNPDNYDNKGEIKNSYAYAAYLYRDLNLYQNDIRKSIDKIINESNLSQYTFNPIIEHNSKIYVGDVFTELSYNTGKFCGDIISSKYVLNDKNVIWSDIYNLNQVYVKYKPGALLNLDEFTSHTFYANFLNKQHIYYYYIELFRNENYGYGDNEESDLLLTERSEAIQKEGDVFGLFELEKQMNYESWYKEDWHKSIFIKRKCFIDNPEYSNHPSIRYVYDNIYDDPAKTFDSFIDWYGNVGFNEEIGLFYYYDKPEDLFELVFTKKFFRVDSNLWDITNMEKIIETGQSDIYKDIYFYRIQEPYEWDQKYANILKIKYVKDLTRHSNSEIIEIGHNDQEIIIRQNTVIADIDTCLVPMFDSIFSQEDTESEIFTHLLLHNINYAYNEHEDTTNYRYNKNNKLMMIEITDKERNDYNITKTYSHYSNCSSNLDIVADDLGYSYLGLNTKVMPDGTKYGFYLIKSIINNTSDTFNLTGIVNDDYVGQLKYIYYINGINIFDNQDYIKSIFKQIAPFTRVKLLNAMQNTNTIVYPNTYNINLYYKQNIYNTANNSLEFDIKRRQKAIKNISLLRYMHSMTPWIKKTIQIPHQYKLKIKDVDRNLLEYGIYNSIGDSPIYPSTEFINSFRPYNVYSTSFNENEIKSYNNKTSEYVPIEYKHYNASIFVNLEEKFDIKETKNFLYSQLIEKQSKENTFNVFKNYINRRKNIQYSDDDLLFLYNKYKVEYDTVPVGLNIKKTEKIYSLTYRFTLL